MTQESNEPTINISKPSTPPTVIPKKKPEEIAKQYLISQTQPIIIPSYSSWYDSNKIHTIEKKALPEFFNGKNRSKNPTIYKDYRDFIVNSYRLNPSEYLTVTACRRNLCGDVCAIMRVHGFLEQWGIINYQVDADTRPAAVGPPFTGHFRVLLDTPRGLMPLHTGNLKRKPHESLKSDLPDTKSSKLTHDLFNEGVELRRNLYTKTDKGIEKEIKEINEENVEDGTELEINQKPVVTCDVCGVDCTNLCYHNTKQRTYDLCPQCYTSGRFPNQMNSNEFLRLDRNNPNNLKSWTDQELLLLLEGLEMYSDDWDKIVEHIGGTKTKQECILEFLRLPIEDEFIKQVDKDLSSTSYINPSIITGSENPVVSVLSFLIGLVDPDTISKLTNESIEDIKSDIKQKINEPNQTHQEESISTEPKEKVNTMDLDDSESNSPTKLEKTIHLALKTTKLKSLTKVTEEEIEINKLLSNLTEKTIEKLDLKLSQFNKLESLIELDRRNLEQFKQTLLIERQLIVKEIGEFKKDKSHISGSAIRAVEVSGDKIGIESSNVSNGGVMEIA
ncbi:hypothetical protein CROQUDRAFT_49584 [Cronartium quercuum f. sp. fusiforme G11]|uniref:SWIRM-domain-containing protein n=1 Tax=Cronartium quercuum f. sp. fusiforme G11 TaxID=708437 RepID=A0A9P6NC74_9BASI|nr:hypothetical protein CROQUDRAFT_49584 [Cronartium quercuum f. sp. fusiforme G11]